MNRSPSKGSSSAAKPASSRQRRPASFTWLVVSALAGLVSVALYYFARHNCTGTGIHGWSCNWRGALAFASTLLSRWRPSSPQDSGDTPAKPEQSYAGRLYLSTAGHCIKKTSSTSSHECGEDAFSTLTSVKQPQGGRTFMGVADGVGGWTESGGDSSKVSVGMLEEMRSLINSTRLALSEVAALAFSRMAASQTHIKGSTTLCTAVFDHGAGRLDISNVGDSGAYIIRGGKIVFKTQLGLVAFNAPHQVGFDQEGRPYGSIAAMETRYSMLLQPGDVVLLVTDGVLDNLYDQEIAEMTIAMVGPVADGSVRRKISHGVEWDTAFQERLKSAATTLAWHSWARSQEQHWKSPFATGAHAVGYQYSGGYSSDTSINRIL